MSEVSRRRRWNILGPELARPSVAIAAATQHLKSSDSFFTQFLLVHRPLLLQSRGNPKFEVARRRVAKGLAGFVAFVVVVGTLRIALAASTLDSIPKGARELAIATLEKHWKPAVSRSPEFYGLTSPVDVSNVRLADPFVLFQLRGESLNAYLKSSENDPRGLAAMTDYCFPVEQPDGTNVGVIIIARNADENGKKWQPNEGDFVKQGFWRPRSPVLQEIREMRQAYAQVYVVRYVDLGIQHYLVKDQSGHLLSGLNKASIRPLAEDASMVRNKIRLLQEQTPSSGEN